MTVSASAPKSSVERRSARSYDSADLSSTAFWAGTAADREKTYAELRRRAPISWHPRVEHTMIDDEDDQGFWAVVTHPLLVEATRRHDDFLSGQGIVMESIPQELLDTAQGFIAMDPPRHTKIRRLLASAFTPKQMRLTSHQIEANAKRVVDGLAPQGEADFVDQCAALLPMHNIFDMMGVPDSMRRDIAWESRYAGGWSDPEVMGEDPVIPRLFQAMGFLGDGAREIIAARRRQPEDDLMTNLVQAEVDGEQLTDDEIVSFFILLTIAGNDTTRQSTSHAMKALTDFPDQRAWLMEDFDGRIKGAVEEFVRWATPIMTFRRTAARDCELGGQQITEGDKIILFYSSANWDTTVFTNPEKFDLSRDPNPHVSFGGGGIHHCLGNQLARQQLAALFRELLHRLPDIEVCGPPSYTVSTFFHGVNHLPVRFTPNA
ncbi:MULTISPECIES: cytochrome P450 [Mycobacteriaceae]|jgi:cytochrome P450|uniref:Unspecific monooxygenase n=13 Tax=Mycobacteriaceae TaxID=1762 RepID=D5P1X1_9MYCO|nr:MULTISPECIES: cytochrome P450 [Mycobacteriaceae]APT09614.1 cytochrome [Mycobacterium avium subsp. hominissuis]ARV80693.1 cytochrome P450 [Mycobacterium intracellulare subsp. chimaera]ASL07630.1 cytochrome P450 [Mycobacterium intracellulare subsp. chimaera]ASL13286.1 cytochrome P450 [Mycobacterium intracellulare subsp. chimaera]ASL19422.1 cytochrome P450 [Mycobacterium intracellulare subsp. chimaera]